MLNDCKYGVNVLGGAIQLTLLRAPKAPDMTADLGLQEFTYAFYAWNGPFAESDVVREAYDLNIPATVQPGSAGERSLFQVDAPNVVIEAVKPAEDGSGDCLVRLYECKRTATACVVKTALPVKKVFLTNMLEEKIKALPCKNGIVKLNLKPFEIATLRLQPG